MREATIDLDWLDAEIERIEDSLSSKSSSSEAISALKSMLFEAKLIRGNCTPVEPPVFLSKTCINEWESSSYCANEGKCEMCQIE